MSVYGNLTDTKAREVLLESDNTRETYFNEMTGHDWTCAKNYNLAIDTSLMPLDDSAELIMNLAKAAATRGL